MVQSPIESFNSTFHKTHAWLSEMVETGGFESEKQAYVALRSVLHSLRDRLSTQEAVHLGAQLPLLVCGFYYDGWRPSQTPKKERTADEFYAAVRDDIHQVNFNLDIEKAVFTTFQVLSNHLDPGELRHVKNMLPKPIQELWPEKSH